MCKIGGKPGAPDGGWYPDGLHIAGGRSPRFAGLHAVVARGCNIVHDPHPSRAGVIQFVDATVIVPADPVTIRSRAERTWALSEIKAAWLQAEETSRPAYERPRDEDDLENSWDHLRGALTGEEI